MGVIAQRYWIAAFAIVAFAANAGTNYTVLRSFGFPDQAGENPDVLIEGGDGALYGSAGIGASFYWNASADNPARGLVFKMQRDGSGYVILHRFTQTNQFPTELVYGTNGVLYGTTYSGGTFDRGTIFRLNIDGSAYAVLHDFAGGSVDGEGPHGLMQGSDGALYGTTTLGGTSANCAGGCGTAFRINPDGSGYGILRNFSGAGSEGKHPMAGLAEGSDGQLYGTTRQGGAANAGTVFRMNKDGSGYTTTLTFFGTNGALPAAALLEGTDGSLYGTTQNGGALDTGTFFKVNTDGTGHQVLHYFAGGTADGRTPSARLVEGTDGAIYGSTRPSAHSGTIFKANKDGTGYEVLRTNLWVQRLVRGGDGMLYCSQLREVFRISNDGSAYQTIRPFTPGAGDGTGPFVLIEGSDRFLYGVTIWGGKDYFGAGTVFKLARDGSGYTVFRYFTNEPAGGARTRSLIEGTDGALYGGVDYGGTFGRGFIFKMNRDGSGFDVIVNFDGTNGSSPSEGLIEGSDGALYGNTEGGGNTDRGVVFKANKDGTGCTVLHSFTGNGPGPFYGLLEATDGWLYGATHFIGSANQGMIFKLKKDGSAYQELHHFTDLGSVGGGPCGGLIEASNGELYGATIAGGDAGAGILFKLKKDGTGYAPLLSFPPGTWYFPDSKRVMQASDGVLYGVTFTGVSVGQGTVYRLNSDGSGYAVLHDFVNFGGDGGGPWGGMIEGRDGALYGTTGWGGVMNQGTIFRYVPQPEITALDRQEDGRVRITARALSSNPVAVEASTNLSVWTEIASGTVVDGRFTASDSDAGEHRYRFYRARLR